MTGNKVVPFGKYKGQPLEVMVADRDYVQWLMSQDWFREKPLYQVIINSGAEPQETPEHNALQVRFLDPGFCERFVEHVIVDFDKKIRKTLSTIEADERLRHGFPDLSSYVSAGLFKAGLRMPFVRPRVFNASTSIKTEEQLKAAQAEHDKAAALKAELESKYESDKKAHEDLTARIHVTVQETKWKIVPSFEVGRPPVDVFLECEFTASLKAVVPPELEKSDREFSSNCMWLRLAIELKPAVSDDYPVVLRQMKTSNSTILLTRDYTGQGATREQFISLFKASGITVVFLDEID